MKISTFIITVALAGMMVSAHADTRAQKRAEERVEKARVEYQKDLDTLAKTIQGGGDIDIAMEELRDLQGSYLRLQEVIKKNNMDPERVFKAKKPRNAHLAMRRLRDITLECLFGKRDLDCNRMIVPLQRDETVRKRMLLRPVGYGSFVIVRYSAPGTSDHDTRRTLQTSIDIVPFFERLKKEYNYDVGMVDATVKYIYGYHAGMFQYTSEMAEILAVNALYSLLGE